MQYLFFTNSFHRHLSIQLVEFILANETFVSLNLQNNNYEISNKMKYENKMRNVVKQNVLSLNKVYIAFVDHKVFLSHTLFFTVEVTKEKRVSKQNKLLQGIIKDKHSGLYQRMQKLMYLVYCGNSRSKTLNSI